MSVILLLAACGAGTTSTPGQASILEAADAHDGAVDKIVHECTGCGLGMPGDAAHAVKHEGYELHFCSDSCKQGFEADPAAGLSRLEPVLKK